MLEPPFSEDEEKRLAALEALAILDTPAEERFDRITRVAKQLFGVSIALISLVDRNRQWFKSRQGLDAPETPRNISFCGHAILGDKVFYIPDTQEDQRFVDNPLVTGAPYIRFYAGAPLTIVGQHTIGTLCIIDDKPHELSTEQLQTLRDLADWVQDELNMLKMGDAVTLIRDQETRLRAVLTNILDGIITIDDEGIVESMNPGAERIFGYKLGEVVGRNVNMLMPEPYHREHDGYIKQYLKTGEAKIIGTGREVEGKRKNGDIFPMELAISEATMNNQRLFVGIVRDITERKRIEKMKNEFVSSVSHELRTPLTSIRGALGLVAGGKAGEISEQARSLINIANNNCERLVRLVSDILDIDKIESGNMRLDMSVQQLLPLVEQAIEANHAFAAHQKVKLKLIQSEPRAKAKVDADRFIQVMDNLLSNAAKFSAPDSMIEISMKMNNNTVRITVADNGSGIPETFREQIFNKFTQVDSSDTRQKGGSGLGLNIAKSLVERFGGKIDYDSTLDKGSRFYFDLPKC